MMKRVLMFLVVGLTLLVIVGYPAGAWYVGKQVEATLGERYKALHDYAPMVTVSDRKYERGIFSSVETLTVNFSFLPPGMASMGMASTPGGMSPMPAGTAVRFTVTSKIRHLPLPGLLAQNYATVDSKLAFADVAAADVAEWTGGQNLATIQTALNFKGGGSTVITIPAFKSARLSSEEATLKISYSRDLANYSMEGNAPRFAIMDTTGGQVQISGVYFKGDHQRIFPDVFNLFSGSDHVSIEQVTVTPPGMPAAAGSIKKLAVDMAATSSADHEFVDIVTKAGAVSINVLGKDYGPAQFDTSFHHVHARTIAKLSQSNLNAYEKNPMPSAKDIEALTRDIEALFLNNPDFRIDRLSFHLPEGETLVSAQFKVSGVQQGDFSNPLALIGKASVSVDFKVPEKSLAGLPQGMLAGAMPQGGGADKKLERMLAEGYVTREGEYLKTRFEFHDAKPWLNGKQYVPPMPAPPTPAVPVKPSARNFRRH